MRAPWRPQDISDKIRGEQTLFAVVEGGGAVTAMSQVAGERTLVFVIHSGDTTKPQVIGWPLPEWPETSVFFQTDPDRWEFAGNVKVEVH